jgi:cell division protein FtsB
MINLFTRKVTVEIPLEDIERSQREIDRLKAENEELKKQIYYGKNFRTY